MLVSPIRSPIRSAVSGVFERRASGGAAAVYPLDDAGAMPLFAYANRRISSAYSGPAWRVVRPSDSAELDIGFVGAGIDTAALTAFLGVQTGRISTWYDQSGNANHATQSVAGSQALVGTIDLGGSPSVFWSSKSMTLPPSVVAQRHGVNYFSVVEHFRSNSFQSSIVQIGTGANNSRIFTTVTTNALSWLRMSPNTSDSPFPPSSAAALFEGYSTPSGTAIIQNDETHTGGAATDVAMTAGFLGNIDVGGYNGQWYGGCVIGYGRVLSAGEKSSIKANLRTVYGIPETFDKVVVFEGDSITLGSDAVVYNALARQAQRLVPGNTRFFNISGGGDQIQAQLNYFSAQAGAILSRYSAATRVVSVLIGTNDLTVAGRTSAQIYADIQTYCANVRASGGLVVVGTLLPNLAWNGAQQTTRNDLNSLIRTNWGSFADGLADYAADATMGPQAASANSALYYDGLHPTVLGSSYLAPIAANAINGLL